MVHSSRRVPIYRARHVFAPSLPTMMRTISSLRKGHRSIVTQVRAKIDRRFASFAPSRPYGTAGVGSCVAGGCEAGSRRAMVRFAEANSRTNNQPATIATPTNDIHMIHRATVGFELLVNTRPNPARYGWLVASTANTSAP